MNIDIRFNAPSASTSRNGGQDNFCSVPAAHREERLSQKLHLAAGKSHSREPSEERGRWPTPTSQLQEMQPSVRRKELEGEHRHREKARKKVVRSLFALKQSSTIFFFFFWHTAGKVNGLTYWNTTMR